MRDWFPLAMCENRSSPHCVYVLMSDYVLVAVFTKFNILTNLFRHKDQVLFDMIFRLFANDPNTNVFNSVSECLRVMSEVRGL